MYIIYKVCTFQLFFQAPSLGAKAGSLGETYWVLLKQKLASFYSTVYIAKGRKLTKFNVEHKLVVGTFKKLCLRHLLCGTPASNIHVRKFQSGQSNKGKLVLWLC